MTEGTGGAPVTFLMTDIEQSSGHWERSEAEMAAHLEEHDRITRLVVERHAGRLFKHTGDGAAAEFAVPADAVAACAVLADGVARPIDLGAVDGAPFVGIASVGFDSEANAIANAAPARLGDLVYAYGALRALVSYRHATFTVEADGAPVRTFTGWSVAVANASTYGGGMVMAPSARLDDGLLDVVMSEHTSRAHLLRSLPRLFRGTHVDDASVHVRQAREVRVSADRPFVVYADGDPIGALPVTVGVRPGAVRVRLREGQASVVAIVRAMDAAGLDVGEVQMHTPTLDDVFLTKTGRHLEGAGKKEADDGEEVEVPA